MAKEIARRLTALEQRQTEKLAHMKYAQLMAYAEAGLLKDSDFAHLTEEQLWWLIAGREEPMPDEMREA